MMGAKAGREDGVREDGVREDRDAGADNARQDGVFEDSEAGAQACEVKPDREQREAAERARAQRSVFPQRQCLASGAPLPPLAEDDAASGPGV